MVVEAGGLNRLNGIWKVGSTGRGDRLGVGAGKRKDQRRPGVHLEQRDGERGCRERWGLGRGAGSQKRIGVPLWLGGNESTRTWVWSLAPLHGLRIRCCCVSCGVGHRCGLSPTLLWLWCRPPAAAPIRPLAWEPPYAAHAALKKRKRESHADTECAWFEGPSRHHWRLLVPRPGLRRQVLVGDGTRGITG